MGARITVYNRRVIGGEPGGDLEVHSAPPRGDDRRRRRRCRWRSTSCRCSRSLRPVRAGRSRLRGAEELRAKETDRIEATVDALRSLGVRISGTEDGFAVTGVPGRLRGGRIDSRGDHRIAMLGAVAGLASREGVRVADAGAVAVSFPGFFDVVDALRRQAAVEQPDRR